MSSFYKLSIKEIIKETADAVSILFNVPEELQSNYSFVAGQYVNVKVTLDGQEIRRAYSICSAPKSGELRIAIKSVKNGFFSKFANEKLSIGNVIEVGTPEGKNYAAFVAGSGITPVFSILKSVLEEEPNSTFVLVYGNKSEKDTIFHNVLHDLQLQYVGRLFVQYVYSKSTADNALLGRIDHTTVNYILKTKHAEMDFSKYYLCGPEEMINLVSNTLKENNISDSDIKFELFSTSSNENESAGGAEGHTKISILVDDE